MDLPFTFLGCEMIINELGENTWSAQGGLSTTEMYDTLWDGGIATFAEGGSVPGRGSGTRDADCCTIGPGTMDFNCSGNIINSVTYNCTPGASIPAGVTVGSSCPGSADGAGSVPCDCFGCGDPSDEPDIPTDPGGHCCDYGAGTYGPAICAPDGSNVIVGISTTNCHPDAHIPTGIYDNYVGDYCHHPALVNGSCSCNVDCGTWTNCINLYGTNTDNWINNNTCWELVNMEMGCPDGYIEDGMGDCVLYEIPPCPGGLDPNEDGVCVDPGDPDFTSGS
jgi:hypothetical protein